MVGFVGWTQPRKESPSLIVSIETSQSEKQREQRVEKHHTVFKNCETTTENVIDNGKTRGEGREAGKDLGDPVSLSGGW